MRKRYVILENFENLNFELLKYIINVLIIIFTLNYIFS